MAPDKSSFRDELFSLFNYVNDAHKVAFRGMQASMMMMIMMVMNDGDDGDDGGDYDYDDDDTRWHSAGCKP